MSTIVLD